MGSRSGVRIVSREAVDQVLPDTLYEHDGVTAIDDVRK
jgi:hypothetical protein